MTKYYAKLSITIYIYTKSSTKYIANYLKYILLK